MKRRRLAGLALAAAGARAAAAIVLRISVVTPPDAPKTRAALFIKHEAEARTGGRLHIEVHPNGSLFKDREELDALQIGAVQMLAPALGKLGALGAREFEAFDLPFLFDDVAQVHRVTAGAVGTRMLAGLGSRNLAGLAFWDNGFKQVSAGRALRRPDDFRGLRVRIYASRILDTQFRALGALPQVLPAGDLYQALQSGLVDGCECTASTFRQFKLAEVQKCLTLSAHGWVGYAFVANKSFWNRLPPDVRTTLGDVIREATAFNDAMAARDDADALAAIRAAGRTELVALDAEARRAWKKALLPVHLEARARLGGELLDALRAGARGEATPPGSSPAAASR